MTCSNKIQVPLPLFFNLEWDTRTKKNLIHKEKIGPQINVLSKKGNHEMFPFFYDHWWRLASIVFWCKSMSFNSILVLVGKNQKKKSNELFPFCHWSNHRDNGVWTGLLPREQGKNKKKRKVTNFLIECQIMYWITRNNLVGCCFFLKKSYKSKGRNRPVEGKKKFFVLFFNFSSNLIWIQGVLLYDLLSSFAPWSRH